MPSPFISSLLLYSILFLKVCCMPTDTAVDASTALDSSLPQQQPPAVDFGYYDSPSANFLASNNVNLDSTPPASSTDTTFGISIDDFGISSSQQDLPGNPANGVVDDGSGSGFTLPTSSTGPPPLLLSSDECDKSQSGDGWHPKNSGANRKRKNKRQLRNCPNPYLTRPNPQPNTNSIKTLENGDEDSGRTMGGGGASVAPTIAIPGLTLQRGPQPNLSLCPDMQRPIPVCAQGDISVPMGDSFLIPKCHACKFFFLAFLAFFRLGGDRLFKYSSFFTFLQAQTPPPPPFFFPSNLPITNTKKFHSHLLPSPHPLSRPGV